MILYMPLSVDKNKASAFVVAATRNRRPGKDPFLGMMKMAKPADHKDNVTKLDKPLLSLKTPSKLPASPRPKTRSNEGKSYQSSPNQANRPATKLRSERRDTARKNQNVGKARNAALNTLQSRKIVFDIL